MSYLLGGTISGHDILTDTDTFINQLSTEIQNGIARSLSNPTQYIVESYALPYAPDQGSQETVTIGWWPSPLTGNPLVKGTNDNYTYAINSGDLDLPSHPQAATRGHYLSTSPYLRYWLYLGIFGFYPLDTLKAIDSTKIHYSIYGDMFGNVKCQLSLGGAIIDTLSANVSRSRSNGVFCAFARDTSSSLVKVRERSWRSIFVWSLSSRMVLRRSRYSGCSSICW